MEKTWRDYVSIHGTIEGARAAFERDCERLLQLEHPHENVRVVRADPGDEGIDIYIGDLGIRPIRVYQCKFFLDSLGESQKSQIRGSFTRAITSAHFKVSEWILCAPLPDFNLEESKWWDAWRYKQEEGYDISIRLLNGSQLISRFKLAGIYNQVFQLDDSLRLAAVHEALTGDGGVAALVQHQVALAQRAEQHLAQLLVDPVHLTLDLLEQEELAQCNPFTALRLLRKLLPQVQRPTASATLRARYNYLFGRALQETGDPDEARRYFLEAYALDKTLPAYSEQAAMAYVNLAMLPEAAQLAAELRQRQPLNAVAYAVQTYLHQESFADSLAAVPSVVRITEPYKLALVELLLRDKPLPLAHIEAVLQADLQPYAPAPVLTFDNRRFQAILAMMAVQVEFNALPKLNRLDQPPPGQHSARLQAAYRTLQRYTALLEPTEKAPLLIHHYYVQGLAGYRLTGDLDELAEFGRRYAVLPLVDKQEYAWEWTCALFQSGDFQRAMAVIEELGPDAPAELDYVRYHALEKLGEVSLAKEALARHLRRGEPLHEDTLDRLLRYLTGYCATAAERRAFVEECLANSLLPPGLPTLVVQATAVLDEPTQRAQALEWVQQATSLLSEHTPSVLRLELARLLQSLEEYTQSAEVLAGCAAAPGIQHSGIEIVRLRNQYHLYQDSAELRARLRTWRQQHGIYPEFCNWEVHLAHLLLDWERILEVTDQVKDQVAATSGVYSTYLFALYRLGRSAELQVALETVVEQPTLLTGEQLLQAAGLAMQEGHVEVALHLAYPLASHREDVQARSRYLALMTHCPAGRPQPVEVGLGASVRYRVNGRPQARLTITEQSLASGSNPLVQTLLGRRAGESFTHLHPLNRRSLHVEVVSITDCYTGLFQEITEELEQHEAAMPFQSVNFGSDTPTLAEMDQTFRELLGEEQKQTQARVVQARAAYAAGDTTFTQLAAALHSGSGLETYHWLTSGRDDSPGLQVLPGWLYPPVADLQQQPIMLDWTSLPLLFTLSRQYALPLPASLWVSHHLLEELREQVREKRRSKPVEMSIEVIDGEVRPHFYPPEMHARQLAYLTDLLTWVESNCQTRLVEEKLDVLRQLKSKIVGSLLEQPLATVVDTAFLVGHTPAGIVVTDDATLLQLSLSMGGLYASPH